MIRLAALPNLDGLVHTAGDHVRVASVHVYTGAEMRVRFQGLLAAPVLDVPRPDRLVISSTK